MPSRQDKIVLTGAAGLVGQNLVVELGRQGYVQVVAIDKHARNLAILAQLHPWVRTVHADLAEPGGWEDEFRDARYVVQLHAQITSKSPDQFVRNNVDATRRVLAAMRKHDTSFLVHVSSSVVNSVANDDYTRTKKMQEALVRESGIACCVLRPTLMFGWFDPKHLGWLSRFMKKSPVFPIPGDGRFMRQPLYERDFCRCILACIEREPRGAAYDIVGGTRINYVDIVRAIKRATRARARIVHIPVWLFALLLRTYALFSRSPPFTADQLKALAAGDDFTGVDTRHEFGVEQTPFEHAIQETFGKGPYAGIVLERL